MARIRVLKFLDGVVVSAPAPADVAATQTVTFPDDASYEAVYGPGEEGDVYYNTTSGQIRFYGPDGWAPVSENISLLPIDLFGANDAVLPTGSATIDGVAVTAGDLVIWPFFNQKIYKALGTGTTITGWEVQTLYKGGVEDPLVGDSVRVRKGLRFSSQLAVFDGTEYRVNEAVKYFKGVDYWEQSAAIRLNLPAGVGTEIVNTVAAGSENIVIEYSILRNSKKQVGRLTVTHINLAIPATVQDQGFNTGSPDVTFTGEVVGSNIIITANNPAGANANISYQVRRWSDSQGGPAAL